MKLKCFNSLCKKYQNSDIIASTQNREKSKVSTENVLRAKKDDACMKPCIGEKKTYQSAPKMMTSKRKTYSGKQICIFTKNTGC